MRGSRMRDRKPPSNPWRCGTRAANFSRRRAILMAFNTPFGISTSPSSATAPAARPRPGPFNLAGPGTSDLLPSIYLIFCCPRASGQFVVMPEYCSALVDPSLAMPETLLSPTINVYRGHYRFSVAGKADPPPGPCDQGRSGEKDHGMKERRDSRWRHPRRFLFSRGGGRWVFGRRLRGEGRLGSAGGGDARDGRCTGRDEYPCQNTPASAHTFTLQ